MNNTYLENTVWNLKFLDYTRKVKLPKFALTQIGDKTATLENLKLLQAKLPSVGYKVSDEMQAVSVALLDDKKTVSVLNLLAVDSELNSDCIKSFGKFLKTKWKFDPNVLADCIKCYVRSNRYSSDSCNVWDIQLLYLLLKTGHERLKDMLYTG